MPETHHSQDDILVIFTYALAGLGHLRVTDALYRGLPAGFSPIVLGSEEEAVTMFHRIGSIQPWIRSLVEWMQAGIGEDVFTILYRSFLRSRTKVLEAQIKTVINQRLRRPRIVLVIATHFALAIQIGAIKEKLMREQNIRILLVVQVTDDSPQHIWYVPGADLIVVPSETTKKSLLHYADSAELRHIQIQVLPYPSGPELNHSLSAEQFSERRTQLDPTNHHKITMLIPVSGAAVGLEYTTQLISILANETNRFHFHIVSKIAPYTIKFIDTVRRFAGVTVSTAKSDREVVELYIALYQKYIVGLEITKPSEQAFKALIRPNKAGGAILLFSHPVGRQEYDNLTFLARHGLIPSDLEQQRLWVYAARNYPLSRVDLASARSWRGLRLPPKPDSAAEFIRWGLHSGLFSEMLACPVFPRPGDSHAHELTADGVEQFWSIVQELVNKNKPKG
jgi:hypothetical protein